MLLFLCACTPRFSSVLGDPFHFMDRPKVRVHHSFKKAYFVALRRAWFMFEPTGLAALLELLKLDGLSDKDIEHKMYYDFAYFRKRKPRLVPPPEQHYHRVRAVYALYGPMKDSTTGLPLFDKTAWGRASNVLGEIRMGYAADPPGVQLYHQSLDGQGEAGLRRARSSPPRLQPRHQRRREHAQADHHHVRHMVHGGGDGGLPER